MLTIWRGLWACYLCFLASPVSLGPFQIGDRRTRGRLFFCTISELPRHVLDTLQELQALEGGYPRTVAIEQEDLQRYISAKQLWGNSCSYIESREELVNSVFVAR